MLHFASEFRHPQNFEGSFRELRGNLKLAAGGSFQVLAVTSGVENPNHHKPGAPMHLKSYQIDGRMLRTGAANFSASRSQAAGQ